MPEAVFLAGFEATISKTKLLYEMDFNIRADFIKILIFLAKYKQKQMAQKNKRADSPEKSLFSLFQKQAGYLSLDKNLLHELELISRENKW